MRNLLVNSFNPVYKTLLSEWINLRCNQTDLLKIKWKIRNLAIFILKEKSILESCTRLDQKEGIALSPCLWVKEDQHSIIVFGDSIYR